MSLPLDDARRRLEDAARGLESLRRATGGEPASPAEVETGTGLRAALEQSRRALEDRSRELELAKARVRELERERVELMARAGPTDAALAERARRAEDELQRARAALTQENAALSGRSSLLQAEIVRLESLRRKAEEAAQNAESSRHGVEETLRRELRDAHAAVDRAAVEAGAREARTQAEVQAVQRRLEAALNRLQTVERDRRVEHEKVRAERERLAVALQRAAAAHAALRKELQQTVETADLKETAAKTRIESLERTLARVAEENAQVAAAAEIVGAYKIEGTRADLEERTIRAEERARLAQEEVDRLRTAPPAPDEAKAVLAERLRLAEDEIKRLRAAPPPADPQRAAFEERARLAEAELDRLKNAAAPVDPMRKILDERVRRAEEQLALLNSMSQVVSPFSTPAPQAPAAAPAPAPVPTARPSLSGGRTWARLVARLRPAVDTAYAQLRGLSATVPLNEDERRSLRRAASALAALADAVLLLERYLDDGPDGIAGPILPALERAVADWRAPLEKRGCALSFTAEAVLPDAGRDLEDLRLVFDQLLRNAAEALPSGANLAVFAGRSQNGGVRVVFEDDGRGLPVEERATPFEPLQESRPGRLGLGLALVRRAMRRWGGDAILETPLAGGTRVVLLFAPASAS
jgi:signal transduction histidine kinase